MRLRSDEWFRGAPDHSLQHRTAMRAMGRVPESYVGRPIIGIANSWSDFNNCNLPLRELVEDVKRGVLLAGGYPMEFHTITTPSDLMKPSDLPYRNLMAMDVEECIRALPMDGVVLMCECDKTCPAQLMAAASCDLPALQLSAGHRPTSVLRGRRVTYGTDLWGKLDEGRMGQLDAGATEELEVALACGLGGCAVMGTASTMKSMSEMLGMMLPGTSSLPARDARRSAAAEATGRRIVEMVREDLRPSRLMTPAAFRNAFRLLAALGGSTNALIHLPAIAGRLGIRLTLDEFQALTAHVPLLVRVEPSGTYHMDAFHEAGGLAVVIARLMPLLEGGCLAATGRTVAETYGGVREEGTEVIARLEAPVAPGPAIAVVRGNLAPDGAVIKRSAGTAGLFSHRGRAVTFESYQDMQARIDSDALGVDPESVLVMKNCGPVGAGMPEWGSIPIPRKLLARGVRDVVRISDARMSGTSYGTVVLHVAPEAAVGGTLALVQDGDLIELDAEAGRLELLVDPQEIARRRARWQPPASPHVRGYPRLFADHVLQAPEGCDLDFLRPRDRSEAAFVPPVVGRG